MNQTLTELWKWVKWVATGAPPNKPPCCVCGDDLKDETEILHRHCRRCWPSYLRAGAPPIKARTILLGEEPDQRLGKVVR